MLSNKGHIKLSDTAIEQMRSFEQHKKGPEFKGLQIKAINQRVIYRLNSFKANELEIGYFDPSTIVKRYGNAGGIDLVSLVDGFRKRNGTTIMEQVKALYHNIGPSLKF